MKDNFIEFTKGDSTKHEEYYKKFFKEKSEQQKFFEKLLEQEKNNFNKIADIGCGSGVTSYYLSKIYKNSSFYLIDLYDEAIKLAKELNKETDAKFDIGSIYKLPYENNCFDMTCAFAVLLSLDDPWKGMDELLRITKPGGKIYISSLFNIDFDVDLITKVYDYTRSEDKDLFVHYNTYSFKSIENYLNNKKIEKFQIHNFEPNIDLKYEGKGIGSFTKSCENDQRLTISAGLLLNWGILEIIK